MLRYTYRSTYDMPRKEKQVPTSLQTDLEAQAPAQLLTTSTFKISFQPVQLRTTLGDWLRKWEGQLHNPITADLLKQKEIL